MPEEVFRLLMSLPSRTVPGIAMYGTPFYVLQHNSADHKPIIRFHLETHITTRVFIIYDPATKTADSRSTFLPCDIRTHARTHARTSSIRHGKDRGGKTPDDETLLDLARPRLRRVHT